VGWDVQGKVAGQLEQALVWSGRHVQGWIRCFYVSKQQEKMWKPTYILVLVENIERFYSTHRDFDIFMGS